MGFSLTFFIFMLSSLFHLTIANFTFIHALCHNDERSALFRFKESLIIDRCAPFAYINAYPKIASWGLDTDCCSWDGVKCNEHTGHVIRLDIGSSCLYGSINSSSSLFHLVHLKWLSLAYNNFNGSQIPSGFINLSRLLHLNLSVSSFSGQIPAEILELSKLVSLDVSYNENLRLWKPNLKSPTEKLTNLKVLDLSGVKISSSIPRIWANLSSLTNLSLEDCDLRGEFPTEIFQLPNLHFLSIRYNQNLTGYLPEFNKSSPLEELRLAGTRFYGTIPSSFGNLTKLVHLDLSSNAFTGAIPSSFGSLTKLVYLDLSFNAFTGELPISIGNLVSLEQLQMGRCDFSGQIPSSLGNLSQLNDLSLYWINFQVQNSRSLSWISKLSKLTSLTLCGLNLVGEIPFWLKNLTQLSDLYMWRNQLSGSIPYWLMNMNQLTGLDLSFNQLTGSIPFEIKKVTRWEYLELSSNQLQGSIPSSIFELKNLRKLNLYSNYLSGTVELDMFLLVNISNYIGCHC